VPPLRKRCGGDKTNPGTVVGESPNGAERRTSQKINVISSGVLVRDRYEEGKEGGRAHEARRVDETAWQCSTGKGSLSG